MKDTPILVSDRGHQPTRDRIVALFDASSLSGLQTMTAEQRARIRAIACLFDPLGTAQFDLLPNLEIVSSFGVGYDHIEAVAAANRGIVVTNTPGVLDDEVADTTIGLLLNTIRELPKAETYLREGKWITEGSYPLTNLTLRNRKVGIFGMGRIGRAIARRLEGFGVPIAYHNRSVVPGCGYKYCRSLLELAHHVDTLINVAPATPQTQKAVNIDILSALGPDGVFVNVGRGATLVEEDLVTALQREQSPQPVWMFTQTSPMSRHPCWQRQTRAAAPYCFGFKTHPYGDGPTGHRQFGLLVQQTRGTDARA